MLFRSKSPFYKKRNEDGSDVPFFVSTPLIGTRYLADVVSGVISPVLSDEEKERIAMHQRLHLAVGHEKKMLMDKLGLGWSDSGDGRKRWRDEMMKLGMGPYFHQSECFNSISSKQK